MRLNVLAVNVKQSNFVSLSVVYILISVFSVVCCENVTSNAINNVPMAAAAAPPVAVAAAPPNSTHSSASLASAAGINKTIAFTIGGGGDASTITSATNAIQSSLADATVTSQVQHHPKQGSQQKLTPLQKQQQRLEKLQQQQQQRAKGIRPAHGNWLFALSLSLYFFFVVVVALFSIHKSFWVFISLLLLFVVGVLGDFFYIFFFFFHFFIWLRHRRYCVNANAILTVCSSSLYYCRDDKMINFYVYGYPLHV